MDLIPSFSVDHTKIVPGIFTSRVDILGDQKVTTYDVRVTRPNVEPAVDVMAMHSLEHIVATYLRNDPDWKDQVIYWGPMGCLTGFYLILKGNREPREIHDLLLRAFRSVTCFTTLEWQSGMQGDSLIILQKMRIMTGSLSIPDLKDL